MGIANTITYIVTAVGIPTIVAALIYVGRKLHAPDVVEKQLTNVAKKLDAFLDKPKAG
jgi:hypothetical protein